MIGPQGPLSFPWPTSMHKALTSQGESGSPAPTPKQNQIQ